LTDRVVEARGGAAVFLGISAVHAEGVVKFPGGAEAELDAYLDQRSSIPRAVIQFKSGDTARILTYDGKSGFERDEAGLYTRAEGAALLDLQRACLALLVAAQCPYGEHWIASDGALEWRDAERGLRTVVELDSRHLPAAASVVRFEANGESRPTSRAAPPRCAYLEWKPWEKILFPARVEYREANELAWTLVISKWEPQTFVADAIFAPPKGAAESRGAPSSKPLR
jgi:hypothetical protein